MCHNILRFSFIMSVMFRSVCSAYSPRCRTRDAVAMYAPCTLIPFSFSPLCPDVNFPIPEFIASQRLSLSLLLQKRKKKLAPCTNSDLERRSRVKYKGIYLVINLCIFISREGVCNMRTNYSNMLFFISDSISIQRL